MTQILYALIFTLLAPAAFAQTDLIIDAEPITRPRAAYVCEALLLRWTEAPSGPLTELRAQVARFFERAKPLVTEKAAAARLSRAVDATIEGLTHPTLDSGFVMAQRLVGRAQIQRVLDGVGADALRLEEEHQPARARQPFAAKFNPGRFVFPLAINVASTFSWAIIAQYVYVHGHPVLAVIPGLLAVSNVLNEIRGLLVHLGREARNAWALRRHAGGHDVRGSSTADAVDREFSQFARDVGQAFNRSVRGEAIEPTWSLERVALPLSRSATGEVDPLTPEVIEAAVRRSGDFPLPADPRTLDVNHYFYHDEALGEPVLLTFVREVAPRTRFLLWEH